VPASERRGGAQPAATAQRLEIRLSGSGGQGIILAATVLADAFVASGKEVVQTQSYGPEARGGASKAEIIVSDSEIDYPEVIFPDLTLCLSQPAFDKYAYETKPGGLVVYDEQLVIASPVEGVRLVGVPCARLAEERLGKVVVANVVALGALLRLAELTGPEPVREALRRRLPARLLELNLKALAVGMEATRRMKAEAAARR
jgi:2-oxoglutarate ferredoxin oxidoreductase subunit gamma